MTKKKTKPAPHNILVTGSAGMIGTDLTKALKAAGHTVTGYDIQDGLDIHHEGHLRHVMPGVDTVIHLAGLPHPQFNKRWEDYFQANVQGTQQVAAVAARYGAKRFIYASSTAYYGAHRGFDFDPGDGIDETAENAVQRYMRVGVPKMQDYERAALAYACSKVAAETGLAAYGLGGRMGVVILRFCPLKADREPYEFGLLLYLEKAVEALVTAVSMPVKSGYEVFNVANEDVTAINMSKWEAVGG